MIFLAVNHHYVAESRPPSPQAVFPTTAARLEEEVAALARGFELVSRDDVVRAVTDARALPDRACLITFDDGLRSQFELALPVLERLGAPALFFVPGLPLAEGRALPAHKLHALGERIGTSRLVELLGIDISGHDEEAAAMYSYDTPEAAALKYTLNMVLPFEEREAAVDRVFVEVVGFEAEFCADLYMDAAQVAELERRHRAVGAHAYAHRPLTRLGRHALREDLERSASVLETATGARPAAISYPFGTVNVVSERVARVAAEAGFVAGFTMERAFNRSLAEPLLLARIDVNDAPGAADPLVELVDGELVVREGMSPGRRRYLTEEEWTAYGAGEPSSSGGRSR